MKKKLWIFCILIMLAGMLAACGNRKEDQKGSDSTENVTAERGTWDGMTYTNRWLGIQFTFPSDAIIMDDEELLEFAGVSADLIEQSDLYTSKQMEKAMAGTVYDAVVRIGTQSSFQIVYENMKATSGMAFNEGTYIKAVAANLQKLYQDEYEIECSVSSPEEVEVAGLVFSKVVIQIPGMEQDFYVRRYGDYMLALTVSYTEEDAGAIGGIIESAVNVAE